MAVKAAWSEPRDEVIRTMRGRGEAWDAVAVVLGCSRWAAITRGRALGLGTATAVQLRQAAVPAASVAQSARAEAGAEPLAPLHPIAAAVLGVKP